MKKELLISLSITVILIVGVFIFRSQPTSSTTSIANPQPSSTMITITEVAKHNSASDCWIIINNSAYNVTSYLTRHPGGSETIIPTCGTDATVAYDAIKGGRGHSTAADADLSPLFIGVVQ